MDSKDQAARDQLVRLIGEIQVADVILEDELRVLWMELPKAGPAMRPVPRDFSKILDDCKSMLSSNGTIDQDVKDLGRVVLLSAASAHRSRNLLLHDRWIRVDSDVPSWRSGAEARRLSAQNGRAPRDLLSSVSARGLPDFEDCLRALRRSYWRVSELEYLLRGVLAGTLKRNTSEWARSLTTLSDQFTMLESGLAIIVDANWAQRAPGD